MSIKTSNTDFKTRIRQQIEDPIMRKAVANAQQRIGANRQKMVDELGRCLSEHGFQASALHGLSLIHI